MINKEVKYGGVVEYWEFLVFLRIWLLMRMIQGLEQKDFWSMDPISEFMGAPF
jgi:hypothetical protein